MYSFTITVPAPIEAYDDLHHALISVTGGEVDGMLLHLGRQTETGYEVTEVWRSKEAFDRFAAEVLGPVLADLSGGAPPPPIMVEPFDLRGLLIPSEHLVI
jgi:hypothetical protein